jgi:hypothetical protein
MLYGVRGCRQRRQASGDAPLRDSDVKLTEEVYDTPQDSAVEDCHNVYVTQVSISSSGSPEPRRLVQGNSGSRAGQRMPGKITRGIAYSC